VGTQFVTRQTMSARGRKLTALTSRKANSRKIVIVAHKCYQTVESHFRKFNACKDLQFWPKT
jgi:hypothetical protein